MRQRRPHLDPFLAVVGASGSGKSSVVHAGLLPRIRSGRFAEGSETWDIQVVRPGRLPVDELAAHVQGVGGATLAGDVHAGLLGDDLALRRLADGDSARAHTVWFVDQAEELFTLCRDEVQRRRFVNNLLHASQAGGPGHVVIALRSDFVRSSTPSAATSPRSAHRARDCRRSSTRSVAAELGRLDPGHLTPPESRPRVL